MSLLTITRLNPSDQRFPCGVVTSDDSCRSKAQFRIYPSCSCDQETVPTVQVCSKDLARAIRWTVARCNHRNTAVRVYVL